jgi:SAM-dependent methyltransferase
MLNGPLEYREVWKRKPVLREVYGDIYRHMIARCAPGSIVEIGGGSGNFKGFAPQTISTDIVSAPWLNLQCDAQRLPFRDASVDNIVMVDVLHHLESPALFLKEAERVLRPNGRLVFCEPAITPFSAIFYRLFHEEPFDLSVDPLAIRSLTEGRHPWESNQGLPTLLVGRYREAVAKWVPGLSLEDVDYFSFISYPLSGGFKSWSLLPAAAVAPLSKLEWGLSRIVGKLAAFRLLASYRKR